MIVPHDGAFIREILHEACYILFIMLMNLHTGVRVLYEKLLYPGYGLVLGHRMHCGNRTVKFDSVLQHFAVCYCIQASMILHSAELCNYLQ
jgi:hypothetical protein